MLLLHKNSLRESLESYFGILGAYLFIASDSNLSKESFHLFKKLLVYSLLVHSYIRSGSSPKRLLLCTVCRVCRVKPSAF